MQVGMRRTGPVALVAIALLFAGAPPAQGISIPFTRTLTDTATPPGSRVGKIYTQFPNGTNSSCSASVVDAPNRSTLITAGHCVYRSFYGGQVTRATFVPGTRAGGARPFGSYQSQHVAVAYPWTLSGHSHFDLAFMVVGPNAKGRRVQDAVGGNPIAFNGVRNQAYRLLGYPSDPPFDGYTGWTCNTQWGADNQDPDPDEQYGPPIMLAGCDQGHGASGGPWLTSSGSVASVISTLIPGSPNVMGGPYLGDYAASLFASVSSLPVAVGKRCKKGKRGRRSAVESRKKCKRKRGR